MLCVNTYLKDGAKDSPVDIALMMVPVVRFQLIGGHKRFKRVQFIRQTRELKFHPVLL
jgi:hypothetical protein